MLWCPLEINKTKSIPFVHIPLASAGCIADLKAEAHKECAKSLHGQVMDGRREGDWGSELGYHIGGFRFVFRQDVRICVLTAWMLY